MKILFFGGGGLRTLDLARIILDRTPALRGGEIALYDLDAARLEAMATMIRRSPECAAAEATVSWSTSLDETLPGCDMVSLSLMAMSGETFGLASEACRRHGFMGSDQISPSGAMLAIPGGKIALACARAMEKHCPDAWLVIRANPVPVLSAAVNNHTRIRALGICDGFTNHMFDLPRLSGRDQMDEDFDVDVAGINHGSLILRGTYHGEDLWTYLERFLGPGWQPIPTPVGKDPIRGHMHSPGWVYTEVQAVQLEFCLRKMVEMYWKHGVMVFSNEGDGTAYLRYEEAMELNQRWEHPRTEAEIRAGAQGNRERRAEQDRAFQDLARGDLPPHYWDHVFNAWERAQITVRLARALGGDGPQKIVASRPQQGAVEGFKDRTVLEFSQWLGPDGLRPVENLAIPQVYQGLMTSLATHQTLLGDAIATEDPRLLYEAFWAYPIQQNTRAYWALCDDLLSICKDEIAPAFQKAREYF